MTSTIDIFREKYRVDLRKNSIYPYLIAVYPALSLYVQNLNIVQPIEIILAVFLQVGLIIFTIFVLNQVTHNKRKSSLIASVLFILIGGFSLIGFLTLISIAINPQILTNYWEVISIYDPAPWLTPTMGMGLRLLLGMEYTWLQLIPAVIGLGWFLYYWSKKRQDWNWLEEIPLILLVGFVTVPYGWTYDMVILSLPVFVIIILLMKIEFSWKVAIFLISYFLINLATMYLHSFLHDLWFMWYAPTLLIWYLIGRNIYKESIVQHLFCKSSQVHPRYK
jgi:hypothetical protein